MARPGDVFDYPLTGERLVILNTTEETGGELLRYESTFSPKSHLLSNAHLHPEQEERHEVVSGQLGLRLAGRDHTLDPGEALVVPAGMPHQLLLAGDGNVQFIAEVRPALRTELFLETFAGLARDGKLGKRGRPGLLQLAVLGQEYQHEVRTTSPPWLVQKALFGLLSPLGRARGYRGWYPEYSHQALPHTQGT